MKRALEDAIYYIHGNDNTYLRYHIITEYVYSDYESFNNVISTLHSDIRVRNIFGKYDSLCYQICNFIPEHYDNLLIEHLDVLLIVTRKDNAIKLSRKQQKNNPNYIKIGIIKIDSVVAELNLSIHNSSTGYNYPLYFLGAVGLVLLGGIMYQRDIGFDG